MAGSEAAQNPRLPGARTLSATQTLVATLAAALLLRLANLGGKSLWLDEAYSVIQSQRPEVAYMGWADLVHPPLHFMVLHYWMRLFGTAETAVRLPSVLMSLLNIVLLYLLARRMFGTRAGLLAAGLLAVSPLDIWYAQEARMYIFVTGSGLLMALGLVRSDWWGGLLFALGLAFGLYADYLTIPLWTGLSAVWFVDWWQQGRRRLPLTIWLLGSVAGWLLYLPWWGELLTFLNRHLGYPYLFSLIMRTLGGERVMAFQLIIALGVATLGMLLGAVLLQRLLHHPRWARPVGLAIVAVFVLVTLSMIFPRLYTIKRVLVTGWPFIILLVVWIIFHLVRLPATRMWTGIALLGLSLLAGVIAIFGIPKQDWRSASAFLSEDTQAGALIWIDPRWNDMPLLYYQPDLSHSRGTATDLSEKLTESDVAKVWLPAERYPGQEQPSSTSERWLDEQWQLEQRIPFDYLELRQYRRP